MFKYPKKITGKIKDKYRLQRHCFIQNQWLSDKSSSALMGSEKQSDPFSLELEFCPVWSGAVLSGLVQSGLV